MYVNWQTMLTAMQACLRFKTTPFTYIIITGNMSQEFLTIIKRKSQRERFYSSMNYDQYCQVYGPPPPLFKPQEDPFEEMPLLELQSSILPPSTENEEEFRFFAQGKMETIFEIKANENFSQNMQKSPENECFFANSKPLSTLVAGDAIQAPKRIRIRMRSQSDNSEYLIFHFLQRAKQKGRKRIKLD